MGKRKPTHMLEKRKRTSRGKHAIEKKGIVSFMVVFNILMIGILICIGANTVYSNNPKQDDTIQVEETILDRVRTDIIPGENILPYTITNTEDTILIQDITKEFAKVGLTIERIENANGANATTGTKIVVKENAKSYTILIYGDCNGDGKVNLIDAQKIVLYYLEEQSVQANILDGVYKEAANVDNYDSIVTLIDAQRIVSFYLEQTTNLLANAITSIEVVAPNKTLYETGEDLDVTGGKVILHYANNTTTQVDMTQQMVKGYDSSVEKEQNLVVLYAGHRANFKVTVKDITPTTFELENIATGELKPGGFITKMIIARNKGGKQVTLRKSQITAIALDSNKIQLVLLDEQGYEVTQDEAAVSQIKIISKDETDESAIQTISIQVGKTIKEYNITLGIQPYVHQVELDSSTIQLTEANGTYQLAGGKTTTTVDGVQYVLIPIIFKDQYGEEITVFANTYKSFGASTMQGFMIDATSSVNYFRTFKDKVFRNSNGTIIEAVGENQIEYIGFALKDSPTYIAAGTIKVAYRATGKPDVFANITVQLVEDRIPVSATMESIADKELKPGGEIIKAISGVNASGRKIAIQKKYITITPNNSSKIEVQLLDDKGYLVTQEEAQVSSVKIISKDATANASQESITIMVAGTTKTITITLGDAPYVSNIQLSNANMEVTQVQGGYQATGGIKTVPIDGQNYVLIPISFTDQYGDSITVKASEYKRYGASTMQGLMIDSITSMNYFRDFEDKVFRDSNGTVIEAVGENEVQYIGFALKETPSYLTSGTIKIAYRSSGKQDVTANITVSIK